ncbi:hypothetical protein C1H46_026943 [Malus baccata]|uniref:DNA topoisomerase (ATP-hydrolyzing) n=1 Tax=Malus baccata TaxID=106549 RepID=A0A540LM16_MALBA|nr:hypothetical protein C1H46_026943 [Malus baccata]
MKTNVGIHRKRFDTKKYWHDAYAARGKESANCTLLLTEGNSAMTLADDGALVDVLVTSFWVLVFCLCWAPKLVLAVEDDDGSHIKGLVISFFHYFWPSLLKVKDFLAEFTTPIIKVLCAGKDLATEQTASRMINLLRQLQQTLPPATLASTWSSLQPQQ